QGLRQRAAAGGGGDRRGRRRRWRHPRDLVVADPADLDLAPAHRVALAPQEAIAVSAYGLASPTGRSEDHPDARVLRQVAGATPIAFLKAREKAASDS